MSTSYDLEKNREIYKKVHYMELSGKEVVSQRVTSKMVATYNLGQNICRLFSFVDFFSFFNTICLHHK